METTNNIVYTTTRVCKDGREWVVTIRLNDECRNGHIDFSITGAEYSGPKRGDKACLSMGANGDRIAKEFPEFQIFEDLHLATATDGAPMFAISNGFYHLKNSNIEVARQYISATNEEIEALKVCEDEQYYQYVLEEMGIPKRWKAAADKAIALLEEWTGKKFKDDSTKAGYTPLTAAQTKAIKAKIKAGYYTPAQIAKRETTKAEQKRAAKFASIKDKRDKEIKKAETEYQVQFAVLTGGLDLDNFIYYNHSNEGVFNWNTSAYNKAVTLEEFDKFLAAVDYSKLPKGFVFKIL